MSDIRTARIVLYDALGYLSFLLKKANNLNGSTPLPCILPDVDIQTINDFRNKLHPNQSPQFSDQEFLELVKNDFGNVGPQKGLIQFKAFATLATLAQDYDSSNPNSRKYKPVKIFEYPRRNDTAIYADFGTSIYMDVASFSIYYDFTPSDHYLIRLNDIKLSLEILSPDPNDLDISNKPKFKPVFTTPPIGMTVEIKIPKPLGTSVDFSPISLSFFGFEIDLDINFPSMDINWSPLKLIFPDWLKWPFGSSDFGSLFGSSWNCNCNIGFIGETWNKLRASLPDFDLDFFKLIIKKLSGLLDFPQLGESNIDYFTHLQPSAESSIIPEWAAIYFNLTGLCNSILGGFAPKQLHLLLGIHKNGQVKVGFLACTDAIGLMNNKSLMLQAVLQFDFEAKTDPEFEIEAHPGFILEVISGTQYNTLAGKAGCTVPPPPAEIDFSGFSVKADRLGILWDRDEKTYVIFIDGAVTIKELVRDADTSGDLTLPFKGLGMTPDGRLVLKKSWITLEKALQIKIDNFEQVVLFLRSYGYGKKASGDFWIGFSGDIELPGIGLKAGVDRLVINSNGSFELSGVNIDLNIEKVLALKGALQWGESLSGVPPLPGTSVKGFGGQLALGIDDIPLNIALGMTYVKVQMPPEKFVAWSFYLNVLLPFKIPVCFGLGINSVGMMVGQNYIPKPKKKGLPTDKWLEQGFNGNVENILDVLNSWEVHQDMFSAGFSIGLVTLADSGFIVNAKAILVLVIPGPIIMIAGKANILSKANPNKSGAFDLLIVYDQEDPGILVSLAFRYDIKSLASVRGMAELYFSFIDAGDWHFYLGTPAKPVAGKVFSIFEARAYLTIDPCKLALGAMVFYGKSWSFGPLSVKAYICFSSDVVISWNPVFIRAMVALQGEIGAKVFGFGLEAGLRAALLVKVPDPWYLFAEAEAKFSISLFFFSWSFTAHLEFSWGSDKTHPDVVLDILFEDKSLYHISTGSLRSYASLLPDSIGNPQTYYYLSMDGVLELKFLRDIEVDKNSTDFPILDCFSPVTIHDEVSEHADEFTRFHGKLTGFKVLKKGSGGNFTPVSRSIYFTWTPEDMEERKKLILRDFDLGYSQFRLNDDPNAYVKLTCPDLYQTDTPLLFVFDTSKYEEYQGLFTIESPVALTPLSHRIDVRFSKSPQASKEYSLLYTDFEVTISSDAVVPIEKNSATGIMTSPAYEIEFSMPSSAVMFTFMPHQQPGPNPSADDFFTLYDETGNDITAPCINHFLASGNSFIVILNHFDAVATPGHIFSAQNPPRSGIKKLVVKKPGTIITTLLQRKIPFSIALFPLQALQDIHQRNLGLVEQQAKLDYVFGQNGDPGKLLWDVGDHKIQGTATWETNVGDKNGNSFVYPFQVIPPFEKVEVEVNGEKIKVQPFEEYIRRLTPVNGERPFYIEQYPVIAYRCNYVNAMLKKGGRRLAMVLENSNGDPCMYCRIVVDFISLEPSLEMELREVSKYAAAEHFYKNAGEFESRISSKVHGLKASDIASAYGRGWKTLLNKASRPPRKPDAPLEGIRTRLLSRDDIIFNARELRRKRKAGSDRERRARAAKLDKILSDSFREADDLALVFEIAGKVKVGRLRLIKKIVEYRYTNDDLALDLSSLQLSDCLSQNQPIELNAYERGYFKPVLPPDGIWDGPLPNTGYTAKIYSIGENDDLDSKRDQWFVTPNDNLSPEIFDFSFTTSLFGTIEGLAGVFQKCKLRDIQAEKSIYTAVLNTLKSEFAGSIFKHPANSNIDIHIGMEIFRELKSTVSIDANGKTPREVEEAFQTLLDEKITDVRSRLKEESLALEDIFNEMGIYVEPTSPKRIFATWLRTEEDSSGTLGTIGLLIEFPEPVDWHRTGINLNKFKIRIQGEQDEKDLLNLPNGNPSYEVIFYWLRSLDGLRLLLIPKLEKTTIFNPTVVIPRDRFIALKDINQTEKIEGAESKEVISRATSSLSMTAEEGAKTFASSAALYMKKRIGDSSIPSTVGVHDKSILDKMKGLFGRKSVQKISDYEVTELEMDFYYFSANYEDKNSNYRAIPRLTFFKGQPGSANGKIGTLIPMKIGGVQP